MDQKKTKKKRAPPYSIRVPKDRQAAFEYNWKTSDKSLSAFVTERCSGQMGRGQHKSPEEKIKLLTKLLFEAAAIKDALDEIERLGPSDKHIPLMLEQANAELALIRVALMTKLGRRS